ncbi:MAG: tetraacyldisaccharide 4'-kinase [Campylobacterota bacterium]|nr:tetraacyldisaccharide 4'-kinase [Campylobacterota bacterium]
MVSWIERYFYAPTLFQKLLSWLLSPLALLYCFIMKLRFMRTDVKDFNIPIVSVGNLTVGGSGKTPLVTALASQSYKPAIVLRGYGRKSQGLHVISDGMSILNDVFISGDEAMIYADKLPQCIVIVSEKRDEGIETAKAMGAKIVFLDDGYSKHYIKKLDIVIDVNTPNNFCLPSGPYRERHWQGKELLHVSEGIDFKRQVILKDATDKMLLVTAIARPERLDAFLPEVIGKEYFPDHHYFKKSELENLLHVSKADSLLVTYKDFVKIKEFSLPLSLLDLELTLKPELLEVIKIESQ